MAAPVNAAGAVPDGGGPIVIAGRCPVRHSRRSVGPLMGARLARELDAARRIHAAILPARAAQLPGLALHAVAVPASVVGGDFYDWFAIDDEHLLIVVADVCGKGIPAAMHMAATRSLLRTLAPCRPDAVELARRLNEQLCRDNDEMMFVTAFLGVLHLQSGELRYVNAGHTPPVVRTGHGPARLLACRRNVALGVIEDAPFVEDRLQLSAGDTVLLYTDGITDAVGRDGRCFGSARLVDVVDRCLTTGAELTGHIVDELRRFERGRRQGDDITCFAVHRLSSG